MIAYLDKYDTTVEVPDDIGQNDLKDINENFHSYVGQEPTADHSQPLPGQAPSGGQAPAPAPTPKWQPNFYKSMIEPMLPAVAPAIPLADIFPYAKAASELPGAPAFAGRAVEEATFGLAKPLIEPLIAQNVKDHPAYAAAGQVAGGLGSLLFTGGALKAAGLGTEAALAGKASVEAGFAAGERFIPRAIMTGATFGTRTFIAETVKAFQDGGVNLEQFGKDVLKDTAFGAIFGSIGGMSNAVASVSSAGALGFISSKMSGADNREASLNGAIWAAFETVGSVGRSAELRMEALHNLKESIGEYVGDRNPNLDPKDARRAASTFVDNAIKKAGYDTAEEIAKSGPENLLEGIEKVNQIVRTAQIPHPGAPAEPLPKLPAPIEPQAPETGIVPQAPAPAPAAVSPLQKTVDFVKSLFGIKEPEPTPAAEAKPIIPAVEGKPTYEQRIEQLKKQGFDISKIPAEAFPEDLKDIHHFEQAKAQKTEMSKSLTDISDRLKAVGVNPEEQQAIFGKYELGVKDTLGQPRAPSDFVNAPIEDQYKEAYNALADKRDIAVGEDERIDARTMQDAETAVNLINGYFSPKSQELFQFAKQYPKESDFSIAQMAYHRGLLEEPNPDLLRLEIKKAKQESSVGRAVSTQAMQIPSEGVSLGQTGPLSTGQTLAGSPDISPVSGEFQNIEFGLPKVSSYESIARHPEYIKVKNEALNVVNRIAKERGITPTKDLPEQLFHEFHDAYHDVYKAPLKERPALAKAVEEKYPNLSKDFEAIRTLRSMDIQEDAFEAHLRLLEKMGVPIQEMPQNDLPIVKPSEEALNGQGKPFALFIGNQEGVGAMYNVYGEHPTLSTGKGKHRTVSAETLAKEGIPVTGREVRVPEGVKPDTMKTEAMVAYHGSPHKFDKFSLHKIGTGEGNQTYGWGLYFSSSKNVAEHYRNNLAGYKLTDSRGNEILGSPKTFTEKYVRENIIRSMDLMGGDKKQATQYASKTIRQFPLKNKDIAKANKFDKELAEKYVKELESGNIKFQKQGHIYSVDIPENDEYLHWDKTLGSQDKIEQAFPPNEAKALIKKWEKVTGNKWDFGNFYEQDGKGLYSMLYDIFKSQEEASKYLSAKGIPGIRYLDQDSRQLMREEMGKEEGLDARDAAADYAYESGSSNYVVFDDKLIKNLGNKMKIEVMSSSGATMPRPSIIKQPKIAEPPMAEAVASAFKESAEEIKTIVNPSSAAPLAAQITRENLAKMARSYDMAEASLADAKKLFDSQPKEANIDFIDKMERGLEQSTPESQRIADTLRNLLDTKRKEIQDLGTGKMKSFIENYFPHIWDQGEKQVSQAVMKASKRPFEGSKGFLKKRSIEFTKDGIEMGLTPVSYNPVDLALLKIREMDKYLMAHRTLNEYKQNGLAKYVKVGEDAPEGWMKIDDRVSTVFKSPMVPVKEAYDAKIMGTLTKVAKALGINLERNTHTPKGSGLKSGDLWGLSQSDAMQAGAPGKIWTRFAGPESAMAHELGHQVDHMYGLQEKFLSDKKIDSELTELAKERIPEGKVNKSFETYIQKPTEKMAVMFESYIHAPDLLQEKAPATYKALEKFLNSDDKLKPLTEVEPSLVMAINKSEVYAGGHVIAGNIYAQPDAARIINNYLSPGLQKSSLYRVFRYAGNAMNQFQLGFSAFHLGFTSLDASVSKFALAINELASGHPIKAIRAALETPFAPVSNIIRGNDLLKAWRGEGQNGSDEALAQAMVAGGGRARMDQFYATSAYDQMKHHFESGNVVRGVLHIPLTVAELSSKPILEWIVPRQKLGVFADMMKMEMENHPDMTHDQMRAIAQKAWDSVDNRMGQLIYDNLFWNRTFKDLLMASVRSVGWNLGTIREIAGGATDYAEALANAIKGKKTEFSYRMAYVASLPILVGILGAITQYLRTGKGPSELKDYYFPKTGGVDAHGDPTRISLPSYMKDLYHYTQHPITTVANKLHPIFSMLAQMLNNKDYYGTKIRNEDDPLTKQVMSEMAFMLKQATPFSIRNMMKNHETENKSLFDTIGPWVGITPAPYDINQTKAETLAHEIIALHQPIGGRTQEQADRSRLIGDLTRQYKRGDPGAMDNIFKAYQEGRISHRQMQNIVIHASMTPLQRMISNFTLEETERVYARANDEEKAQIERILQKKQATRRREFVPQEVTP